MGATAARVGDPWTSGDSRDERCDNWLLSRVQVILGTPTANMPAWLAMEFPEALSQKADGTRTVWGGRPHNCFSGAGDCCLSERIVRKMDKHYAHHPSVVGWQIDDEFAGNDCRCDRCRAGFQS